MSYNVNCLYLYRLTQAKNIMVSASTRKGCYISILNIIQGAVDPSSVSLFVYLFVCMIFVYCLNNVVLLSSLWCQIQLFLDIFDR